MSALNLLDLATRPRARLQGTFGAVQAPAAPAEWTLKGSRDFVTEVDRTAERIITEILLAGEPGWPDGRRRVES